MFKDLKEVPDGLESRGRRKWTIMWGWETRKVQTLQCFVTMPRILVFIPRTVRGPLKCSEKWCDDEDATSQRSDDVWAYTWPSLGFISAGWDYPGGTSGKELACQSRRHKRHKFSSWVRKIPRRRAWIPTPVFLPGESHGQRRLMGYSP